MRKLIAVLFAAAVAAIVVAAPAMAHQQGLRDPFVPVIDTTGAITSTGEGPVIIEEGEVPPEAQTEVMANTGVDTEPWLVAAYVLVAVGGGIIVLSKTLAPTPVRTRRN